MLWNTQTYRLAQNIVRISKLLLICSLQSFLLLPRDISSRNPGLPVIYPKPRRSHAGSAWFYAYWALKSAEKSILSRPGMLRCQAQLKILQNNFLLGGDINLTTVNDSSGRCPAEEYIIGFPPGEGHYQNQRLTKYLAHPIIPGGKVLKSIYNS